MTKIGVVGCGYWGAKHARSFHEIPEAQLAMVCDLSPERLAHIQVIYPTTATTQSFSELLESNVDGVVIATPPSTHYSLATQALAAGKHVLVEKPFVTNSDLAADLVMLAEAKAKVLMVGHTYEYNPAVEFLRDYVASGQLGELYYIDAARLSLGLFQPDVDVVWDLGPHEFSMFMYILGQEPVSVGARGAAHVNPDFCEVAYIDMVFPSNVLAHVHVSWLHPQKVRRVTLVGSEKMVVFDDLSESDRIRIYNRGVTITNGPDLSYHSVAYRDGEVHIPRIPMSEPLKLECQHFVECIRDGKRPRSDGLSGLRVVRILEKAQTSLQNGGRREPVANSLTRATPERLLKNVHQPSEEDRWTYPS